MGFPEKSMGFKPVVNYKRPLKAVSMFISLNLILAFVPFATMLKVSESDSYDRERERILKIEKETFMGGALYLSQKEKLVDDVILKIKTNELAKGYENVSECLPSQHFFNVKDKILKSEIFAIIKKLPKGGSLHTHFLAGVSIDYIINNITYKSDIYGGYINGIFKLKFFANGDPNITSGWKKIEEYRKNDENFDNWLREQLSLEVPNPSEVYPTADAIWKKFKKTFTTQYDMVCYRPIFEEYIYELLNELYLDNVMYTELRGTFMALYELNGTIYNDEDFFTIFVNTVENFKKDHPNFIGVRYIHNLYRGVSPKDLRKSLKELLELKNKFPNFIIGYDFVGHEEEGHPLYDFHEVLLEFSTQLKFYFHAGETNWFGHTDINLLDAILLNTSRIGHGFGLNKHPAIAELAKEKNICIELCPISNQVLKLIDDLRNHPIVNLLSRGFPVVICNDDPAVWGATGLSFDWYATFMAMTSKDAGLKVLKQFAVNSILFSAMDELAKDKAIQRWNKQWETFLDEMIVLHKISEFKILIDL